jgi:hypothetical protein
LADKHRLKGYTRSQITAIILFVSLIVVSLFIVPIIVETNAKNINTEQARYFHIVIYYNFNNTGVYGRASSADIEMDLKMHYPHGTLIVDDPVEISGTAALNSLHAQNVRSIVIGFENSYAWPITQNNKGITKTANLFLDRVQDETRITGNTTIAWTLEGTYHPSPLLQFTDGTVQTLSLISSEAITVYPQSMRLRLRAKSIYQCQNPWRFTLGS